MPVDTEALFKAAVMLAEVEEIQVSVVNTFAASAVTALAGTGGFLLLGPPGFAIGATLAGLGAYGYNKNKFKPLFVILQEDLRPQQQQELLDLLRKAFEDVDHMDFVKLSVLMMNKAEMWVLMRTVLLSWVTEHYMKGLAGKVETKQMTDLEKYQKFTEDFKRQHRLPGAGCPPALGMAPGCTNRVPAAAGWRAELAGGVAGLTPTPEASALTDRSASHPVFPPSSEDDSHPKTAPKTTLKTF